jgi:hypothetical protein
MTPLWMLGAPPSLAKTNFLFKDTDLLPLW